MSSGSNCISVCLIPTDTQHVFFQMNTHAVLFSTSHQNCLNPAGDHTMLFVFVCDLYVRSNRLNGEEVAGLCASRTLVYLFCACILSFFSFSWCRGLAAVCDCSITWTFLLTFCVRLTPSLTIQDKVIGDVTFPVCHNDNCQVFSL